METKANPNPEHGCLAKALPDEPMFILLGRDPGAPAAIRRWVKYRRQLDGQDEGQLQAAENDAVAFAEWREENDGRWRNPDEPRGQVLIPTDEVSSTAGRLLGCPALDDDEADQLIEAIKGAESTDAAREAVRAALAPAEKAARQLAGFVLNADPQAGPQDG